uniref:Uncharacterized protein n=1 Tax=Amphimedon queenslandica TaxID=400682 RepID=A0A1X7VF91_AMPQE
MVLLPPAKNTLAVRSPTAYLHVMASRSVGLNILKIFRHRPPSTSLNRSL